MKRKPVAMDLVCGKGGWSGDVADQDGRLKMFDSDDSATMAGYVSDRIQELSKKFRGKKVKVYQDPVTRLMPEGVGIIRAIALDRTANDDPPFFSARVQFEDGVFERRVQESDIVSGAM